tara:strand:- start:47019 stop:47693 length:675 start_codon:yes stop_codon:yes gene_type:complete
MRTPLYAICNTDWTLKSLAYSTKSIKAVTGDIEDATAFSVAGLRDRFVIPITQTPKPSTKWQDVSGSPDVDITGDPEIPETMAAVLVWASQPVSLEAAKAKLKERAKMCKFARMDGGVEFDLNGATLIAQTDSESRSLLMASYFKAVIGALPNGRNWRFLDNSYPLLTTAQVIALGDTVDAMVSACYDQQNAHDAAIALLPDLDACKAYDCSVGFPAVPSIPVE